ncbi:MAG: protein-disulfide reductase DsbD domain-containing protein [Verrucomicrobiota bacterium]
MLPAAAANEPTGSDLVQVRLLAENREIAPGEEFVVGLEFTMDPHWHIYWRNPGDSGLAPQIDWELPEGFQVGELMWPVPERIEMSGLVTYGYENRAILLAEVTPPASLSAGENVQLAAKIDWLVCKDICLPGSGEVALEMPVVAGKPTLDPAAKDLFTAARQSLPATQSDWNVSARPGPEGQAVLVFERKEGREPAAPEGVYFFAQQPGVINPNAPQPLTEGPEGVFQLSLTRDPVTDKIESLPGILVTSTSWVADAAGSKNWAINPKMEAADGAETSGAGPVTPSSGGLEDQLLGLGLPGLIILSFLGGLILNAMPCVLPVLSLKVFSLVKHSDQSQSKAVAHGLAYTVGVVVSFLFLAGVMLALRAAGEQVGWAFQLQNPIFVTLLAVLFFLFGLNLFGVFEVGGSLVGADASVSGRGDLFGSFGTGVLAAVVGAPCIGPFLGAATGLALQASAWEALLLFGVIGLGLASPFLLLAFYPKARVIIPKPGAWMEAFKQLMGFLLMFAVLFLLLTISSLSGPDTLITVLLGLIVLGMAAWVYGRWSAPHRAIGTRWVARAIALGLAVYGGWVAVDAAQSGYDHQMADGAQASARDGDWAAWSPERVEEALAAGKPVFVDFTATWCLICQVNKKGVLKTAPVEEAFAQADVVTLEADWTHNNPLITNELEKFGRSGVPLYLLYSPQRPTQPEILPQTLSQSGVIKSVESL